MKNEITLVSLLVRDYDEAIEYYTQVLGFELVEDTQLSEEKRWVRVRPAGSNGVCLLLAKAGSEEQKTFIGNQTGGRVFLFIHTDDFEREHNRLKENRVEIVRGPTEKVYGKVLVFKDLYGNLFDLIEPIPDHK